MSLAEILIYIHFMRDVDVAQWENIECKTGANTDSLVVNDSVCPA